MSGKTKPLHKIHARLNKYKNGTKLKLPKCPEPKLNSAGNMRHSSVFTELSNYTGNSYLTGQLRQTGRNKLETGKSEKPKEKPVIGAGRGGVHYGKVSSMGRMAESAISTRRR